MNEITDSLKKIGLSEKETAVYTALLKYTEASVSDIADEAGIKRPTTYLILDELRKKGMALEIPHAKKSMFQAKTPDELYGEVVSNMHRFEKMLPKLRDISPSRKPIKTLYFEGSAGVKEALYYHMDKLKDSVDDGFFAKNDGLPEKLIEVFDKWNKDREKRGIKMEGITPDHPSTREYIERYKSLHTNVIIAATEDYDSDVSIEVTKEFIRIIDGHEMKAVIIENPRVVHALRQIFALAKRNYTKTQPEKTVVVA